MEQEGWKRLQNEGAHRVCTAPCEGSTAPILDATYFKRNLRWKMEHSVEYSAASPQTKKSLWNIAVPQTLAVSKEDRM
jgi:hypothetical protein